MEGRRGGSLAPLSSRALLSKRKAVPPNSNPSPGCHGSLCLLPPTRLSSLSRLQPTVRVLLEQRGRLSHLNSCQGKVAARRAGQSKCFQHWVASPGMGVGVCVGVRQPQSGSRAGLRLLCSQKSETQVLDPSCASNTVSSALPLCPAPLSPCKSPIECSQCAGGESEAPRVRETPSPSTLLWVTLPMVAASATVGDGAQSSVRAGLPVVRRRSDSLIGGFGWKVMRKRLFLTPLSLAILSLGTQLVPPCLQAQNGGWTL